MVIAVDTFGGDYAPHEVVKGAIKAAEEYGIEIALVGNKAMLHVLAGRYLKKAGIKIIEASQTIGFHEPPTKAIRSKPDSSIVVGINLVRDGAASAFVSAGSTGAIFSAALFNLGKIEGIERPALCCILDITPAQPVLLLDVGANVNCRPSHLVQFAHLANSYCKQVIGISSPRVGLLSNGEEETKGTRLVQETHQLLKKTNLNFIGNVEGHDIPKGTADIIVTDGFTGNIVLKTIEGLGDTFSSWLQQVGHALLRDLGLGSRTKRIDYRECSGVCLLGVKGNVIIAHGRSQSKAIKNAIGLAKRAVERNFSPIIKEEAYEQINYSR